MHLHFERSPNAHCDCPILSITWMGKVPDEMPDEEGWKLNRTNYYQEGWLGTGNVRGVVGVTFTSCHCKKVFDVPLRTNYNLRGHRSEVALVKWNEPYQKLASCDSTGIIFVWIKYEGRWSIELINDRNTQVTDFSWSHDGRMALICYQDGFVLVGSVAGQRYWSTMLNLEGTITCGVWTPDDQQVLFGTSDGQIIVMDVHGAMLAQVSVLDDVTILAMSWSCEKFKMEEGDDEDASETSRSSRAFEKPTSLAVSFQNGLVYIMKNYDDVSPIVILTGLKGLKMEWTNAGDILAMAGCASNNNTGDFTNMVQFYTENGALRYTALIPYTQHPVSALTWGHNDKRLFVATGPHIHVGWITKKVASLQLLSRFAIYHQLQSEEQAVQLLLPRRLKNLVVSLFSPTIKSCFLETQHLRDFVCHPPLGGVRYYCTMIRHDDDLNLSSGTCYTLYLEYLGGLVPLLKGKRSSKIRPEFIIYDPQVCVFKDSPSSSDSSGDNGSVRMCNGNANLVNGHTFNGVSDFSDSEYEDGCASPRMQRRRKHMKKLLKEQMELELRLVDNLAYVDTLPEHERLVEVTSNIWGTKFKMHGVDSHLPSNLGQVTYKTSLLHLQPRQMTLCVTELRNDLQPEVDPSYNPNLFSEDEDDAQMPSDGNDTVECLSRVQKEGAPIAPMTPRKQITTSCSGLRHRHHIQQLSVSSLVRPPAMLDRVARTTPGVQAKDVQSGHASVSNSTTVNDGGRGDSDSEEFPYVDFTNSPELLSLIERESQSYAREFGSANGSALETESSCYERTEKTSKVICLHGGGASGDVQNDAIVEPECRVTSAAAAAVTDFRSTSFVSAGCCENGTHGCMTASTISNGLIAHHPWRLRSPKRSPTTTASVQTVPAPPTSAPNSSPSRATSSSPSASPPLSTRGAGSVHHCWAEKAYDLKFIDEDEEGLNREWNVRGSSLLAPSQARLLNRCRSHSVGHLNTMDVVAAAATTAGSSSTAAHVVTRVGSLREMKRRLILSQDHAQTPNSQSMTVKSFPKPRLIQCGKSRSLDSGSVFQDAVDSVCPKETTDKGINPIPSSSVPVTLLEPRHRRSSPHGHPPITDMRSSSPTPAHPFPPSPLQRRATATRSPTLASASPSSQPGSPIPSSSRYSRTPTKKFAVASVNGDHGAAPSSPPPSLQSLLDQEFSLGGRASSMLHLSSASVSSSTSSSRPSSPLLDRNILTATPPTPKRSTFYSHHRKNSLRRKSLLNSPLLSRRSRRGKVVESSDDEMSTYSGDETPPPHPNHYKDLESYQKAHIRHKLRSERLRQENSVNGNPGRIRRREFVMHNKAPLWNENSQVYQLDFGGRVTQESAKNFQIEFRGKQVMQFGRIDGNAYTLDFQYPFTAIQAFAVALANVTQRLK